MHKLLLTTYLLLCLPNSAFSANYEARDVDLYFGLSYEFNSFSKSKFSYGLNLINKKGTHLNSAYLPLGNIYNTGSSFSPCKSEGSEKCKDANIGLLLFLLAGTYVIYELGVYDNN